MVLRGDPAHKIVNPVLYRYEEARACWQQVARAGAVGRRRGFRHAASGSASNAAQLAERRAAFRDLQHVTVPRCRATCCITTSPRPWRG